MLLLLSVVVIGLAFLFAGTKPKCICPPGQKGSIGTCPVCHPGASGEWVNHKDEELGVTKLPPTNHEGAQKGIELSNKAGR